jgi:hypothetical protein
METKSAEDDPAYKSAIDSAKNNSSDQQVAEALS